MERRPWLEEKIWFAGIGIFAVGSSWALLYGLTEFAKWWYQTSLVFALAWNYSFTFIANRLGTYRNSMLKGLWWQVPAYLIMIYGFYEINWRALRFLVEDQGMWYMAGQVLISLMLSLVSMALSPWIFREKPPVA